MSRLVLPENALNGGFPEPPADEPVLVVDAHHDTCGVSTRVRLPGTLPTRAVRRFHCAGCAAAFEAQQIEEIEVRMAGGVVAPPAPEPVVALAPEPVVVAPEPEPAVAVQPQAMEELAVEALTRPPKARGPRFSLPDISLPELDPDSRSWKLISIAIAGVLVVGILLALNGGDDQAAPVAPAPTAGEASVTEIPPAGDGGKDAPASAGNAAQGSKKTKFVSEGSFSLALPKGWEKIEPPAGATFAAVAADGGADATLWITEDPKLDFPTFINQSLTQLETLAPDPQILERIPGPTPESTVVTIGAEAPAGQPTYEATLRVAGPYRYYLGTTVQPDATPETADSVDLITGSLTPELEG